MNVCCCQSSPSATDRVRLPLRTSTVPRRKHCEPIRRATAPVRSCLNSAPVSIHDALEILRQFSAWHSHWNDCLVPHFPRWGDKGEFVTGHHIAQRAHNHGFSVEHHI